MFNTLIEIYLDLLIGPELYQALLNQLLWALGLILASQVVLRIGIKRLVILGG
jgi:ABC-type uncharacterized transport system permease subunit